MSLAADEIFKSDRSIIDIAFEYGFEGQESFTRAFKKLFDLPPAKYLQSENPLKFKHRFELSAEVLEHFTKNVSLVPKIIHQESIKMIGYSSPFRGVFEEDPNAMEVIPALWKRLFSKVSDIKKKYGSRRIFWCYGSERSGK